MLIIPAIDIINGQCVRLRQGEYTEKTVYHDDPVSVANTFLDQGATWLHVVDLDGAEKGSPQNLDTLQQLCGIKELKIQFGGGIRTADSVQEVLDLGIDRVIMGSALVRDLDFAHNIFKQFGAKVVAGIDTKNGQAATHGWKETSTVNGLILAKSLVERGCRRVIFTDIAKDGELQGPATADTAEWVAALNIPVVASGGVSALADLAELSQTGSEAVIVGKALYENRFTLGQAIQYIKNINSEHKKN